MKTGTGGNATLIVVDMLNDFVLPGAPLEVPETRKILPALRRRIGRARRGGELVVYVCDAHRKIDPEVARMGWPDHVPDDHRHGRQERNPSRWSRRGAGRAGCHSGERGGHAIQFLTTRPRVRGDISMFV